MFLAITYTYALSICCHCWAERANRRNLLYVLLTLFRATMPELYPLFYENLQDNIPSVREGAAIALGNVTRAYSSYTNFSRGTK